MKIRAIVRDHSDYNHTAFRTEPPATKQVVEFAVKTYLGEPSSNKYCVKDGLFIVAQTWVPQEQVTLYEDALTHGGDISGQEVSAVPQEGVARSSTRARKAGRSSFRVTHDGRGALKARLN